MCARYALQGSGRQVVQIRVCHAKQAILALADPPHKVVMGLALPADMETPSRRLRNVQGRVLQGDTVIQVQLRQNAQDYASQVDTAQVVATTATVMAAVSPANSANQEQPTALFAHQDTINLTLQKVFVILVALVAMVSK